MHRRSLLLSLCLLLALLLTPGCDPVIDLGDLVGATQSSSSALPDGGASAQCAGLTEATCKATSGCQAGYTGLCDCTCPGPGKYEAGGCATCPASCFQYAACVSVP